MNQTKSRLIIAAKVVKKIDHYNQNDTTRDKKQKRDVKTHQILTRKKKCHDLDNMKQKRMRNRIDSHGSNTSKHVQESRAREGSAVCTQAMHSV